MVNHKYFKCEKCSKKNRLYSNEQYTRCWCCNFVTNTEKLKKKEVVDKGLVDIWTPSRVINSTNGLGLEEIRRAHRIFVEEINNRIEELGDEVEYELSEPDFSNDNEE
jgi:hypothetical protein